MNRSDHERAQRAALGRPRSIVQRIVLLVRRRRGVAPVNVAGAKTLHVAPKSEDVERAEQDEHERDGELHGESYARGKDDPEENDGAAHEHDGERVTDPPECAHEARRPKRFFAAHDRRHGDHVIRVGRVAHAEKKPERQQGEEAHLARVA
jgi:hypothetical protein